MQNDHQLSVQELTEIPNQCDYKVSWGRQREVGAGKERRGERKTLERAKQGFPAVQWLRLLPMQEAWV